MVRVLSMFLASLFVSIHLIPLFLSISIKAFKCFQLLLPFEITLFHHHLVQRKLGYAFGFQSCEQENSLGIAYLQMLFLMSSFSPILKTEFEARHIFVPKITKLWDWYLSFWHMWTCTECGFVSEHSISPNKIHVEG